MNLSRFLGLANLFSALDEGSNDYLSDEEGDLAYVVHSSTELWDALYYRPLLAMRANLKSGKVKELLGKFGQGDRLQEAEFIISEREEGQKLMEKKPQLFDDEDYLPKKYVLQTEAPEDGECLDMGNR